MPHWTLYIELWLVFTREVQLQWIWSLHGFNFPLILNCLSHIFFPSLFFVLQNFLIQILFWNLKIRVIYFLIFSVIYILTFEHMQFYYTYHRVSRKGRVTEVGNPVTLSCVLQPHFFFPPPLWNCLFQIQWCDRLQWSWSWFCWCILGIVGLIIFADRWYGL